MCIIFFCINYTQFKCLDRKFQQRINNADTHIRGRVCYNWVSNQVCQIFCNQINDWRGNRNIIKVYDINLLIVDIILYCHIDIL